MYGMTCTKLHHFKYSIYAKSSLLWEGDNPLLPPPPFVALFPRDSFLAVCCWIIHNVAYMVYVGTTYDTKYNNICVFVCIGVHICQLFVFFVKNILHISGRSNCKHAYPDIVNLKPEFAILICTRLHNFKFKNAKAPDCRRGTPPPPFHTLPRSVV